MSDETRVKEALNLIYHGLKASHHRAMFREVREWLRAFDADPDIALSDFAPDRMAERIKAECELREMAKEESE